jgi:Bacterial membrane protein YfhO
VKRLVAATAALLLLAALFWFGLGMHRGLLLSNDVKSMSWPWAPSYPRPGVAAPALSDPVWHFVPWLTFARSELLAGRLPLWNPHQDGGVPLLGNAQSGFGTPLVWPPLFFGVPAGWNLSLLLRLLLAFSGLFLWLRDAGRSVSAAALGGFAFALSGPSVAWLEHLISATAAPVPLLLFFLRRITVRPTFGAGAGLAAATYLVLAGGHPETQLTVALLAGAYLALLAPGWRRAATAVGIAAVGAGLAAPLLLPFLEYYRLSEARLGIDRQAFVLPVSDLIRFVKPFREGSNVIEAAATVSITALAFTTAGATRWREREIRFWLFVAACLLLVTYENPVARLLSEKTPIYWTRALVLLPIPLGYLAARGWDWIRTALSRRAAPGIVRLADVALPLLVAAELLAAARGVHGSTDPRDLGRTPPIVTRLKSDRDVFRILPLHTFLPPNTATEYGLDDVRGYDAIAPRGWRVRREEIGRFENVPTQRGVLEPWEIRAGGRGLDFWNVKYLLLHPKFAFGAETLNARKGLDLLEIYSGPDGKVLLNRRALPRARLARPGRVDVREGEATRWSIDVETPAENELLVANPFFPGWRAQLDGRPVELTATPGDPIRLRVSPGRHRVALFYRPDSFRIGLVLAGLSLVAGLVLYLRFRRVALS